MLFIPRFAVYFIWEDLLLKKTGKIIIGILVAVAAIVLLLSLFGGNLTAKKVSYFTILEKIKTDEEGITKVTIDEYKVVLYARSTAKYYAYYDRDNADSTNEIKQTIIEENSSRPANSTPIDLSFTDPNAGSVWSSLLPIMGTVLVALLLFFWMRSARRS